MAKKKAKKKNSGPPKPQIQLSQCMITKNEEKNIRQALSWAKGIAFEQIVVDTGSTDKTVEIAEEMGAKVFHFKWINDFSAAKNYAIEQATGNWIAFLDADEYFSKEDAQTLYQTLKKIRADEDLRDNCLVLNVPLVNVDDNGKPVSVFDQERVFRNIPQARYIGRIHERIDLPPESLRSMDNISIIHTGYAKKVFEESDKLERNIEMLKEELAQRPDDIDLKGYLADALRALDTPEEDKEADALYYEIVNSDGQSYHHRLNSYRILIDNRSNNPDTLKEAEELCRRAFAEYPDNIDIEYFYGTVLNKMGEYTAALEVLKRCEQKLINAVSIDESAMLTARPELIFAQLGTAAKGIGDIQSFVKYATMTLSANKTEFGVLGPFLQTLVEKGSPLDEIMELLAMVYDMKNPSDLLFIARTAKDYGVIEVARHVIEMSSTV